MTNAEAFTAAHTLTRYTIRMEREIAAAEGRDAEACDYRATFALCLKAVYALRSEGCTIAKAGGMWRFLNHIVIGVPWAATLAFRAPRPARIDPIVGMLGTGDDLANAA